MNREYLLVLSDALDRHASYLEDCNLPRTTAVAVELAKAVRLNLDGHIGSASVETAAEACRIAELAEELEPAFNPAL